MTTAASLPPGNTPDSDRRVTRYALAGPWKVASLILKTGRASRTVTTRYCASVTAVTPRQFTELDETTRGAAVTPPIGAATAAAARTQVSPTVPFTLARFERDQTGQAARAHRSPVQHHSAHQSAGSARAALTFSTSRQAGPALARVPGGSHQHRQEIDAMGYGRPPRLTQQQSAEIAGRDCATCGKPASEERGGRNGCVAFHDGERWQFRAECVACWNASVEAGRAAIAAARAAAPRCEGCGKGQRSYVLMPGTPDATEVCRGCKRRVDTRIRAAWPYAPNASRAQILAACKTAA